MFDDPKKDLKWLQEQLLAEELREEEDREDTREQSDEDWFGDQELWLDEELEEARELLEEPRRPFDYDAQDEDDAPAVYADPPKKGKAKKEKKPKKEKGIGGLVFLACLEVIGIAAVLVWWALWLL